MSGLRFSIVIPTRERAATLYHSLRTCLSQQFDSFEVIVSDNAGSPATRAVVESLASPQMRYVRTPRLMAMSSNWNFAVGHAEGEFVFVLGDDDGLLPHALVELDRFITTHDARAVRWTAAYYTWPDHAMPGVGNYLRVPLARGARYVEARLAISEVIAFRRCYSTLPMLYNSVVHRDLIDTLRNRSDRVFSHRIPDIYSGFAVAAAAGGYWSLDTPMSVSGQSGQSTGVANLFLRGRSAVDREFRDLNAEDGLLPHPHVPDLPLFPFVPVAEAFLRAKELFFPDDSELSLDRRHLARVCAENVAVTSEADWREALAVIHASFADDPKGQRWFDVTLGGRPFRPLPPARLRPERMGCTRDALHLEANRFGVVDVYEAAALCGNILAYDGKGIPFDLAPGNIPDAAGDSATLLEQVRLLQQTCDARQAVIDELLRTAEERLILIGELDRARQESEHVAAKRLAEVNELRRSAGLAARIGRLLRRLGARGRSVS